MRGGWILSGRGEWRGAENNGGNGETGDGVGWRKVLEDKRLG